MPDVKFELGLDNRIKPGEQTLNELIATLQGQGHNPLAANVIRDPISGKLISVEVNLPDTAAADATNAINANAGVATATPPLPAGLGVFDLENISATALNMLPITATVQQNIQCLAAKGSAPGVFAGQLLGEYQDVGSGDVYVDRNTNTSFEPHTTILMIYKDATVPSSLTIAPSDLVLTFDGSQTVTVANASPIVLKATVAGVFSQLRFYVDITGKAYLAFHTEGGVRLVPARTYADAVAAGAL